MKKLGFDLDELNEGYVSDVIENYGIEVKYSDSRKVFNVLLQNKQLFPTLRIKGVVSFDEYIKRWFEAYNTGFESRPSVKVGKKSTTVPDEIVKVLMAYHFDLEAEEASKMEAAHAIMMTLENLTGELLEEYLDFRLKDFGWMCAWGSTIRAVDFCHPTKGMLQVKNSDNSENSSSSSIREGTDIQKWFRRFSRKKGEYNWSALVELTGCDSLSEYDFRKYSTEVLRRNPQAIATKL